MSTELNCIPPSDGRFLGGGKLGDLNDSQILNRVEVDALKTGDFAVENVPDKGLFVTTKATITHIKRTGEMSYASCPTAGCCRKVIQRESTGAWACQKCAKEFPEVSCSFPLFIQSLACLNCSATVVSLCT